MRRFALLLAAAVGLSATTLLSAPPSWKAGTAAAKITPEPPMYLAGFGGRSGPAEGKLVGIVTKYDITNRLNQTALLRRARFALYALIPAPPFL